MGELTDFETFFRGFALWHSGLIEAVVRQGYRANSIAEGLVLRELRHRGNLGKYSDLQKIKADIYSYWLRNRFVMDEDKSA